MLVGDYEELRLILDVLGSYLLHPKLPLYMSIMNMRVTLEKSQEEVDKLKTIIKFLENKIENMEYEK